MTRAAVSRLRSFSRRTALALVGGGALLLGGACAPTVLAERTPGYDLEGASTYAWVTEELVLIQLGEDQPTVRTKDNELRIRAAVDRELAKRGLRQAPRDEAQLLAAFSVGVRMRYRVEGVDPSAITATGPGEPQTKGTLNIYLIDRAQETEIWHGSTSKWLSKSDDPEKIINQAVARIMAVYPGTAP